LFWYFIIPYILQLIISHPSASKAVESEVRVVNFNSS
jgi:hypothetical protein